MCHGSDYTVTQAIGLPALWRGGQEVSACVRSWDSMGGEGGADFQLWIFVLFLRFLWRETPVVGVVGRGRG